MRFILSDRQGMARYDNIASNPLNFMANIERGSCRFKPVQEADGKFVLRMEMFHQTLPLLKDATVDFELLNGTTMDQARKLAESVNDRVTGVLITRA
jgi:hypothetical protein